MNLNKQFFTGGRAIFTVQNDKDEHYTFKISQPKGENKPYFASLLTGPDNTSSYTYIGIFNPITGTVFLTRNSRYTEETKAVRIIRWAIKKVWNNETLPPGYDIRHEGKCGCCGRKLTTPESLDRGIGPECWSRIAG